MYNTISIGLQKGLGIENIIVDKISLFKIKPLIDEFGIPHIVSISKWCRYI